jgi:hypothetical protein
VVTQQHDALLLQHLPDPGRFDSGEAALMPALMRWLVATGRVRAQTRVAHEVPWLGRRVDLALLTGRGLATAFELKIGRLQRVIEQAAYNQASFHRSWIVTGNRPKADGLHWAIKLGVGLLVVQRGNVFPLVTPTVQVPNPAAVKRLRAAIEERAGALIA